MTVRFCGADFRHKNAPGYRNINEICEQRDQLHACETLFGDYDAEVMVLLQDASNFDRMRAMWVRDGRNPFRHNPRLETNKNLFAALRPFFPLGESVDRPANRTCGVYYANAVWLLKDTTTMQGPVDDSACDPEIFQATLGNLERLRLIIACGKAAYDLVASLQDQPLPEWAQARLGPAMPICLHGRPLMLGTTFHPGKWGTRWRVKEQGDPHANGAILLADDFRRILESAGFQPQSR